MIKHRSGFTLLELMFALAILSISLITIFQLVGSSNRKTSLTAEIFSAIQLTTKVRANLNEEMRLNPAFIEMIHEYPEMTDKEDVVDGRSWYFRWGNDRSAPFGIINSIDGPAFVEEEATLYSEFKPFKVSFGIQRIAPDSKNVPDSHLCETTASIEWKNKLGKVHTYGLSGQAFSPSRGVIPDGLLIDQTALLALISQVLFPECVGLSLGEAADLNGCNRELAFHAGRVAALTTELDKAISSITVDISELVKQRRILLSSPNIKLAAIQIQIARKTEDGASLLYNVLAECGESLKYLTQETDPARLGSLPAAPYVKGLKLYATLGPQIYDWVEQAGLAYEWLLQPGLESLLTGRERENAVYKRLEAYRLLLKLKPAAANSASFAAFIKREADRVEGKNPHLIKFFLREDSLRKTPGRYSDVFPNLKEILRQITVEILPNGRLVPELISRHAQGGQI